MKFTVQFYSKRGYVKTVVNETITSGLGEQIAEETVKIAQENNSNLLLILLLQRILMILNFLKQLQLTVGAMLGYLIDLKMQKSG
jgi:hypothetical protein